MATAVAGDVPARYDVVINGKGYMFAYSEQIKGESSYTPIVADRRTNTQSDLPDSQFDFWMTFAQTDWSLGAQQRYIDTDDGDSLRRFWESAGVNVDIPGEATLHKAPQAKTASGSPVSSCDGAQQIWFASNTNLYSLNSAGSETDHSTHSVTTPATNGMVDDENHVYISSGSENTVRLLEGQSGTTYAEWVAASGADELTYHNNQIYGYEAPDLSSFSAVEASAGSSETVIHSWLDGEGAELSVAGRLLSFGPKLYILVCYDGADTPPGKGTELWEYDGTGVSKIAEFPVNFLGWHMRALNGIIFIIGNELVRGSTGNEYVQAIYYYAGGNSDLLWRQDPTYRTSSHTRTRVVPFDGGLYWLEFDTNNTAYYLNRYVPQTGAISRVATVTGVTDGKHLLAASWYGIATLCVGTTSYHIWPHPSGTTATTGTLNTSLFDAGSTLSKHWEDVIIDYDEGSDGDGGSIDVAYQMETLDGSYTSIQTGVTSGTAYDIDVAGQAISLQITLNKGTSTDGPKLKRVRLRGTPLHPQYRRERYVLNLQGVDGTEPVVRRDNTPEPDDGTTLATQLRTAFTSGNHFSVTDEFGTYNAVFDTDGLRVMRVNGEEYIAIVELRES